MLPRYGRFMVVIVVFLFCILLILTHANLCYPPWPLSVHPDLKSRSSFSRRCEFCVCQLSLSKHAGSARLPRRLSFAILNKGLRIGRVVSDLKQTIGLFEVRQVDVASLEPDPPSPLEPAARSLSYMKMTD